MKILVTGGAGYIGTTLVPILLEAGHDVSVFDYLRAGADPLLPFFRNRKFSFTKGDVREKSALAAACAGADAIIHLAAIVGFPACIRDPWLATSTNVDGAKNLVEVVSKDQYVLLASTGSNYGDLGTQICTEESPLNPLTLYGGTKTEAEKIIMEGTTATALRFATAFGVSPRMRLDLLINDMTYQALKQKFLLIYEPHFKRTFIHVVDIARSFLFALNERKRMTGQIYNTGDEVMNYSKREVTDLIGVKTGARIEYADVGKDLDKRDYTVSYKKIREVGYHTTVGLEDGIDELVRTYGAFSVQNPYLNL